MKERGGRSDPEHLSQIGGKSMHDMSTRELLGVPRISWSRV